MRKSAVTVAVRSREVAARARINAVSMILVKLLITGRFLYVDCQGGGGYRYIDCRQGMVSMLLMLLTMMNKQVRVLTSDSDIHVP